MKLEFTMAADVALVARPPQPTSTESPTSSSAVTPSTPTRDQGSCAPTRAQPMPSSTRCLARSRTEAGTSASVVLATQVASRPVGPAGSVAGRAGFPVCPTATGASVVVMSFSPSLQLFRVCVWFWAWYRRSVLAASALGCYCTGAGALVVWPPQPIRAAVPASSSLMSAPGRPDRVGGDDRL